MIIPASSLVALARRAAAAAVNAQADLAQEATLALVPRDTGALAESIKVDAASTQDLRAQVYTDAEWALYQHEALNIRHATGQAKFMEAAVSARYAAIRAAGADAAKRILG